MKPDEFAAKVIDGLRQLNNAEYAKASQVTIVLTLDDQANVNDDGSQTVELTVFPKYKKKDRDFEKLMKEMI